MMIHSRVFLSICFLLVLVLSHNIVTSFQSSPVTTTRITTRTRPYSVQNRASPTTTTALHSSLLTFVDTFFRTAPYAAAAITCGCKASAADYIAQRSAQQQQQPGFHKPRTIVAKRNAAFIAYGALYQGVTQEYVYNHLYPAVFGCGTGVTVVLSKVLFDLLVQTTLVTLPIAYLTKAAIFQYSIGKAMRQYVRDIREHGLLKKYFLLWGPVQCLTFSVVPEHYRVSFIACVSFFWLIILSSISSRGDVVAPSTAAVEKVSVKALEKLAVVKEKKEFGVVASIGE